MEHLTMTATTLSSGEGVQGKFSRLWIGQEEVPIAGRSISQCLEEMIRQGWNLTTARAKPNHDGTLCVYEFQRPGTVSTTGSSGSSRGAYTRSV